MFFCHFWCHYLKGGGTVLLLGKIPRASVAGEERRWHGLGWLWRRVGWLRVKEGMNAGFCGGFATGFSMIHLVGSTTVYGDYGCRIGCFLELRGVWVLNAPCGECFLLPQQVVCFGDGYSLQQVGTREETICPHGGLKFSLKCFGTPLRRLSGSYVARKPIDCRALDAIIIGRG
ncbi:uncharacterized protein G2W53_017543 [Senna tora]|uniref:Uncharacterized protein n=1 Tax=Senna tora TaxID=362788 RepID=A0A834TYN5_9FABA|nr:uncharacterized protein G2W53_017543 [Senna tora]